MDLSWSAEQQQVHDALLQFGTTFTDDGGQRFDADRWRRCGEAGVLGLPIPAEFGGRGQDALTTAYALEGFGSAHDDNGLNMAIGAHLWGAAMPLLHYGSEQQKHRYLPAMCAGDRIGALAVSEAQAGSDVAAIATRAERDGDNYHLNGHKLYISNAPVAGLFIVLARTQPQPGPFSLTAFVVERDTPGLSLSADTAKMGLASVAMSEMTLDNVVVAQSQRLGSEGGGFALFHHAMEWERGLILAPAVGAIERLLRRCREYTRRRQQFGRPIAEFQLVASKLVDMRLRLESARAALYKVAWLKREGKPAAMAAAIAKLTISEAWVATCHDALQLHGALGYLVATGIERELRDAIGSLLYSGTSEMQRLTIARLMATE